VLRTASINTLSSTSSHFYSFNDNFGKISLLDAIESIMHVNRDLEVSRQDLSILPEDRSIATSNNRSYSQAPKRDTFVRGNHLFSSLYYLFPFKENQKERQSKKKKNQQVI